MAGKNKAKGGRRAANCRAASRLSPAVRHTLLALAALFLFSVSAWAQVQMAEIPAHPALWTVKSRTTTLYLFGSIHLLPANLAWHTPKIDAALGAADTFVFETPIDDAGKAAMLDFVRAHGLLPKGQSLRAMLPEKSRPDYDRVLALAHLAPAQIDNDRPWLAGIVLDVAYLQQMHYLAADGIDQQVLAYAHAHNKALRYFETPAQQLSLFMPKDEKLELEEFDAGLKQFESEETSIGAMVDAWGAGDVKAVARLMNKSLESEPDARKLLIDDRNKAWIKTLGAMLAAPGTYFVTVGTGHLAGPVGVPALLRAQGYRVEGP